MTDDEGQNGAHGRTAPRAKPATIMMVDDEPKRPRRSERRTGGKVEGKTPKRRLDRRARGGSDATSAGAPVSGRRRGGFLGPGGLFGGTLRALRPRLR
jgi:hypothetical protein